MTSFVILNALLRETKRERLCQIRDLVARSKTCRSLVKELLRDLQEAGVVAVEGEEVRVATEGRLRIAGLAIAGGADPEKIMRELRWQEFEAFADHVLGRDGYATTTHFVFKASGHRYEIDVLGAKEPLVLCVDCKHWHRGCVPARLRTAVKNQLLRVHLLSESLRTYGRKLATADWQSVRLLPVILTLADVPLKLIDGVPVVSSLRLRSFVSEISPWLEKVRFVDVETRCPSSSGTAFLGLKLQTST
jgi:hypothetical protein